MCTAESREYRSWCVILHRCGKWIRKTFLTDSFIATMQQHYSEIPLHFRISFISPRQSRNICFYHGPGMLSPRGRCGLEAKFCGLGLGLVKHWPRSHVSWPRGLNLIQYRVNEQ